jgi:hypothetical protein
MPTASQAAPATAVSKLRAMTVIQAANVPRPPNTANSGRSIPDHRTLNGALYQASSVSSSTSPASFRIWLRARRQRSPISAKCAIVNESIAPNV